MHTQYNIHTGFSVVEAIVVTSVFTLFVTSIIGVFVTANTISQLASTKQQAVFLAQEGLEAVRNIRDENFLNLTDGTYGLVYSGTTFALSGTEDVVDGFVRTVEISEVDTNIKEVTSTVNWEQKGLYQSVTLPTQLTYWQEVISNQADDLVVDISAAALDKKKKELLGITIQNIGLFDIVIDKITVSWDNGKFINEIEIGGTRVWMHNNEGSPDGKQLSGTEIDIVDFTLTQGSGAISIDKFGFSKKMDGATFIIKFTLLDGTEHTVNNISP
jgi:hypothetical protein